MAGSLMPGMDAADLAGDGPVDRRALRRTLLEHRLALPADVYARHSARICELLQTAFPQLSGMRVGFCWPFSNEPDLRPLVARWHSQGHPAFQALLPIVREPGAALAFRAWSPDMVMRTDRYGIPAPVAGGFVHPEALLIPVNGFDADGYRIGYGGGYFDRTLAALEPRPLAIGVGFELSRLDSIHPAPHDQPLDVMVTEAGVYRRPA
ncbi:MAG: 5-formyltetrahydrofolate cyclo-ligase [Candidatus Accumulibacter sp.]|uniref:5-formyltetrahydrofolate cyclo-ligase n=1 Tax=Accumulibacter sp. TaxID=2053492 RepID=UPI001A391FE5|nr:5-formyltetrahydrofolate cyclo-ligase [Accumulibacter sp.]MBL8395260.1 5-formyltetrahydrofolate cyclo-ligase [Accumulibacter sp.]